MLLDNYVRRYKAGDEAAFNYIYNETIGIVKAAIYSYIQNKDIIDDLTQDVYMKMNNSISKYNEGNFKAWIYQMAKNTALDYLKKKKEVITDNVYYYTDNDSYNPYLKYLILHMEKEEQEIFLMKVLLGYTTKNVSKLLTLNISRVNRLYKSACLKLKKGLEDVKDEIK